MRKLSKYIYVFLLSVVFIQIGLFIFSSLVCHITVSELWSLNLAKNHLSTSMNITNFTRLPFLLTLSPIFEFTSSNVHLISYARGIYVVLALVIVWFCYQTIILLSGNKNSGLLCVSMLLGLTDFFSRGFRIRADLLVSALSMGFIYYFTKNYLVNLKSRPLLENLLLPLILFLVILCTPKSIYFCFILFLSLGSLLMVHERNFIKMLVILTKCFVVPAGVFFLFFYISFLTDWVPEFSTAYLNALIYYIRGQTDSFGFDRLTGSLLAYIDRYKLVILLMFILIGFGYRLTRSFNFRINKVFCAWMLFPLLCSIVFILHNQQYPFFMASLLPLIVFPAFIFFPAGSKIYNWVFALASILFTYNSISIAKYIYYENNNIEQFKFIRNFEDFVRSNKEVRYFDGVGLLPIDNKYYYYLGPEEIFNKNWFEKVKDLSPTYYLYTGRSNFLEPELTAWLQKEYKHMSAGVWVKCNSQDYKIAQALIKDDCSATSPVFNYTGRPLTELFKYDHF